MLDFYYCSLWDLPPILCETVSAALSIRSPHISVFGSCVRTDTRTDHRCNRQRGLLFYLLPLNSPRLGGKRTVELGTFNFFCPRGFESRRLGNTGPSGGGWRTTIRYDLF